eukprot:gene37730-22644_t
MPLEAADDVTAGGDAPRWVWAARRRSEPARLMRGSGCCMQFVPPISLVMKGAFGMSCSHHSTERLVRAQNISHPTLAHAAGRLRNAGGCLRTIWSKRENKMDSAARHYAKMFAACCKKEDAGAAGAAAGLMTWGMVTEASPAALVRHSSPTVPDLAPDTLDCGLNHRPSGRAAPVSGRGWPHTLWGFATMQPACEAMARRM